MFDVPSLAMIFAVKVTEHYGDIYFIKTIKQTLLSLSRYNISITACTALASLCR